MDILGKLELKKQQFEQINNAILEKQKAINEIQSEIAMLDGEIKRLQGEYRAFVEIGQELGMVDDQGQPIAIQAEQPEVETPEVQK